jgi:exopolysaccharide biosynthesis protein
MKKWILSAVADLLLAAAIAAGIWFFGYQLPGKGIHAAADVKADTSLSWKDKFANQFSDTIISNDTTYKSPDISITISRQSYETNRSDPSEAGKHLQYGTKISYVLADIYISDINCIRTTFAKDTYGIGYTESLVSMSSRLNSLLAVNGDSYSNSRNADNGTIVRNGVIYRNKKTSQETCVLRKDGTMKIYPPGKISRKELTQTGAWQSWVFGPSLLDENGKPKQNFITWPYIRESHPRTAIGYFEPGHYCLLVVDGRQSSSRGMYLEEMASLFAKLGCRAAYNLDGGHCSFMTKDTAVVNHPYKSGHTIQDGIFITEANH